MKHIFTIHSPITFLAALGTIVYENIATENVVFICGGNFEPNLAPDFKGQVVPSYDRMEASFSFVNKIKHFNYTKSANDYIAKVTENQSFIAYVDLMSVFNRYLVMHSKCQQFHVIEEGIVNYADYDDFMLWTADLKSFDWQWKSFGAFKQMANAGVRMLRGRSLRLLAMPIHPNLYTLHQGVNAYCFSDAAFKYTPANQKKVLSWKGLNKLVSIAETTYANGDWFWIGDTLCKSYGVRMEHFENALQQLLETINPRKEVRIIHVKFRGSESETEKKLTLTYLERYNFKVQMVAKSEMMEMVFLNHAHLNVCGIASSLLIYANEMGHQTHSLFPFIPNQYNISLTKSYFSIAKKVGFLS